MSGYINISWIRRVLVIFKIDFLTVVMMGGKCRAGPGRGGGGGGGASQGKGGKKKWEVLVFGLFKALE